MGAMNRRQIAAARVNESAERFRLGRLAAADNPATKAMLKPREEETGIAAMALPASANTCMICSSSHITTAILPCKHTQFCFFCINKWNEKTPQCPVCRGPIQAIMQLIMPFDVQDESRKRERDPVYAATVADALEADAAELRKRGKPTGDQ
jgi:hypothetical protein